MALDFQATPLIDGEASARVLRLAAAISFWGGVDAQTGCIVQGSHPDKGVSISGTILVLPGLVGSSSSSAIMLELLYGGKAPAALLLPEADAILALGVIVAREMGYGSIPVLTGVFDQLHSGMSLNIKAGGRIVGG